MQTDVPSMKGLLQSGCLTNTTPTCNLRRKSKVSEKSVAQSYPTFGNAMDSNPPGSSVHQTPQARILEWVAIPFVSRSLQPRDQTPVFCTARRFFTILATREAQSLEGEINFHSMEGHVVPDASFLYSILSPR